LQLDCALSRYLIFDRVSSQPTASIHQLTRTGKTGNKDTVIETENQALPSLEIYPIGQSRKNVLHLSFVIRPKMGTYLMIWFPKLTRHAALFIVSVVRIGAAVFHEALSLFDHASFQLMLINSIPI
jgi:hypothetical protein